MLLLFQRCVFGRSDLLNICISFAIIKSQPFHRSILLPLSTHQAASSFQMMWKLQTFIHPFESLSYTARKKEGAFFVTVAPSQLQNTVTYTVSWSCPQNDSSQLCSARRGARAALPGRGSPQFTATLPSPRRSERTPGNPKEHTRTL